MLDNLIREVSARWGLADQGRPLVQMLVAHINNPATGGLTGFLDKFRKAGWGGMVNTWVSNTTTPEVPTTSQIETVLGPGDGFLTQASSRLALSREKVVAAVAGILPMLIDRMTPDGTIPMSLPTEFDTLAREGHVLLGLGATGAASAAYGTTHPGVHSSATAAAPVPVARNGVGKWLPWLIAALAVILGVSYCSKDRTTEIPATPAATTEPVPQPVEPAPAASDAVPALSEPASTVPESTSSLGETANPAPAADSASTLSDTTTPAAADSTTLAPEVPGTSATAPDSAASASTGAVTASNEGAANAAANTAANTQSSTATTAENFTVPEGADVVDDMVNGMPVLRVFFDTGKDELAPAFKDKSHALVEFLKANTDVTAVISGFNDPTGDAARNAELAKQRAQAVKTALESAGIPADRVVLEKPAETTPAGATNAASRRVDVMMRR